MTEINNKTLFDRTHDRTIQWEHYGSSVYRCVIGNNMVVYCDIESRLVQGVRGTYVVFEQIADNNLITAIMLNIGNPDVNFSALEDVENIAEELRAMPVLEIAGISDVIYLTRNNEIPWTSGFNTWYALYRGVTFGYDRTEHVLRIEQGSIIRTVPDFGEECDTAIRAYVISRRNNPVNKVTGSSLQEKYPNLETVINLKLSWRNNNNYWASSYEGDTLRYWPERKALQIFNSDHDRNLADDDLLLLSHIVKFSPKDFLESTNNEESEKRRFRKIYVRRRKL